MFDTDRSPAAIINHLEVAILGRRRTIVKSWVVNDELAVRKVSELTLARIIESATAARR